MTTKNLHLILSLLFTTCLLAGCAATEPYLVSDYRYHERGTVVICLNEETTPIEKATEIADEICGRFDRIARLALVQPGQCSWAAPSQANFQCIARPGEKLSPVPQRMAPLRHDVPLGSP